MVPVPAPVNRLSICESVPVKVTVAVPLPPLMLTPESPSTTVITPSPTLMVAVRLPLAAEVTARADGDGYCFDAVVRDDDGHVYVEVQGYRTAMLPGGVPEDVLSAFKKVVPER